MPEAAVDEDRGFVFGENDVRLNEATPLPGPMSSQLPQFWCPSVETATRNAVPGRGGEGFLISDGFGFRGP